MQRISGGKERPRIIADILSNYMSNNIVKVDLYEFEEKFIEAHTPIHETIRILCHSCHRKYDRFEAESTVSYEENEVDHELNTLREAELIEQALKNIMSKASAIQLAGSNINQSITNSNVVFANANKTVPVWWLEPSVKKFQEDLFFILNDTSKKTLNVFKIPSKSINPTDHFDLKKGKNVRAKIIVPISSATFTDKNNFSFDQFLISQVSY